MSRKEIDELKTLIQSLEIRKKHGELTEEEYTNLKDKYSAKLADEMALLQSESILHDMSYISISGSGKITPDQITVSGSASIEGIDGNISLSGSGKVSKEKISVSGSLKLPGDTETQQVSVSGAMKVDGSLKAEKVNVSGSLKLDGPLFVQNGFYCSGSAKVSGDIDSQGPVEISGAVKVSEGIRAESCNLSGSYRVGGDVICQESFYSELSDRSEINGNLEANGDIEIIQENSKGRLTVETITSHSGKIILEGVRAKKVIGKSIELKEDCQIDEVIEQ